MQPMVLEYATHGAGICTPTFCPCPKSASFEGKYTSTMEHMGMDDQNPQPLATFHGSFTLW